MASLLKISTEQSHALHDIAATRWLEGHAKTKLSPSSPSLMQRAGLATARLALAIAPHARLIWVACGPGHNGGDGFEAARVLHDLGKRVHLTWTEHATQEVPGTLASPRKADKPTSKVAQKASANDEAVQARERALAAGLRIHAEPPAEFDLAIDALLGIGGKLSSDRPGTALITNWLQRMQNKGAPVLCVDVPTGLDADSGAFWAEPLSLAGAFKRSSHAGTRHTLSLLTLKPGLFTATGRDHAGQVWFDDLGVSPPDDLTPCAYLLGGAGLDGRSKLDAAAQRLHATHKGSYGDVAVIGGETRTGSSSPESTQDKRSMTGAALLAARAALRAGAGRVYVALVGEGGPLSDPQQPELMFRAPQALDLAQQVVVCGCGGGQAVRPYLPLLLSRSPRLVLDADALNAIAQDNSLQTLLRARHARGWATVLTPHPLEAARLLETSAADVQNDRRHAAQSLAQRFMCTLVLKGSGSIVAAPGRTPLINHSGNGWLATAGTGDVLAGMLGAALAAGHDAWSAAARATFEHGKVADDWLAAQQEDGASARSGPDAATYPNSTHSAFTASLLVQRLGPWR